MMDFKVEWVPDTQLFDTPPVATKVDGLWKSCTPVPVVRLAEVEKMIRELEWAMQRLCVDYRPSVQDCQRAQACLASVAAWRKGQEGKAVVVEQKQTVRRSCNLHQDCDVADPEGKMRHCRIEDCEDCYGQ